MVAAPLDRALRLLSRLALGLALLTVLGGGSTCSFSSSHHDDDDDSSKSDDDDEGNLAPAPDEGGLVLGAQAIAQRLARLGVAADLAPSGRDRVVADVPPYRAADYLIEQGEVVAGAGPGAPAVARIAAVRGLSLFDLWGPGEYGAAAFALFADRVRVANESLLGLPPAAGGLALEGATFLDDLIVVRWLQTPHVADGLERALPGRALSVVFDSMSRLIQVENDVQVPRR